MKKCMAIIKQGIRWNRILFIFVQFAGAFSTLAQTCSVGTQIPAGNYTSGFAGVANTSYYIASGDVVVVSGGNFTTTNGALCNSGSLEVTGSISIGNATLTNDGCIAATSSISVGNSGIINGSTTNSAASISTNATITAGNGNIDNYGIIQTMGAASSLIATNGKITNESTGVVDISNKITAANDIINYNCMYAASNISSSTFITNGFPASAVITSGGSVAATFSTTNHGTINQNSPAGSSSCSTPASTLCNDILPIVLLSFSGTCDGDIKKFTWSTATETNNAFFILERSRNGIDFTETKKIKGAGNSLVKKNYETEIEKDFDHNYHRLKQIDFNGRFSYSNIIQVNCLANYNDDVFLFPNPATEEVSIKFRSQIDGELLYSITDIFGRGMENGKTTLSGNDLSLPVSTLSSGIYFIRLDLTQMQQNFPILKLVKN